MPAFRRLSVLAAILTLTAPVLAEPLGGSLGYRLIQAVKSDDRAAFDKITTQNASQLNAAVLDYVDGDGAIHIAAREGKLTYLNNLLVYGANPNLLNKAGDTPMIVAVVADQQPSVELLLRGRAQIDAASRSGKTALIAAVEYHRVPLIELLLAKGANPDKADFSGNSARTYAAADTRYPAIAKLLAAAPRRNTKAVAGPKLN